MTIFGWGQSLSRSKASGYEFEIDNKELNYFISINMDFWMGGENKFEMGLEKEDGSTDWKPIAGTS